MFHCLNGSVSRNTCLCDLSTEIWSRFPGDAINCNCQPQKRLRKMCCLYSKKFWLRRFTIFSFNINQFFAVHEFSKVSILIRTSCHPPRNQITRSINFRKSPSTSAGAISYVQVVIINSSAPNLNIHPDVIPNAPVIDDGRGSNSKIV